MHVFSPQDKMSGLCHFSMRKQQLKDVEGPERASDG